MRLFSILLLATSSCWAAFPTVSTPVTTATAAGTSHVVSLGTAPSAGDLITIFVAFSANPGTITWTGSSAIGAGNNTVYYTTLYKTAVAEGTTVTISTVNSVRGAWATFKVSSGTFTGNPEAGTVVTATTASPDPPSLSPSWGAHDTTWVAIGAQAGAQTVNSYPTNYGSNNATQVTSGGGANSTLAISTRNLNTATEDPGATTFSASKASLAQTVAIQGVGGGGTSLHDMIGKGIVPVAR